MFYAAPHNGMTQLEHTPLAGMKAAPTRAVFLPPIIPLPFQSCSAMSKTERMNVSGTSQQSPFQIIGDHRHGQRSRLATTRGYGHMKSIALGRLRAKMRRTICELYYYIFITIITELFPLLEQPLISH